MCQQTKGSKISLFMDALAFVPEFYSSGVRVALGLCGVFHITG